LPIDSVFRSGAGLASKAESRILIGIITLAIRNNGYRALSISNELNKNIIRTTPKDREHGEV
jgi:hypothetical protein